MLDKLTLVLIEQHLPELHKERWNRVAADLAAALAAAPDGERAARQRLLDQHYANRHQPESSRAALTAQAEANAAQRRGDGR